MDSNPGAANPGGQAYYYMQQEEESEPEYDKNGMYMPKSNLWVPEDKNDF